MELTARSYKRTNYPMLLFGSIYLITAYIGLKSYLLSFSTNGLLGMGVVLLTINIRPTEKTSSRFLYLALLFAASYLLVPAKTLLFASIAMALCFLIESWAGKVNFMPLFALVFMSPIFTYISDVFSFPLRLFLTSLAVALMRPLLPGVRAEGNMVITDSSEFSVDPACMGLFMLVTSLLAALMLVAIVQKRMQRQLSVFNLIAVMITIVVLNIISNLFRIICLVYFTIAPGTIMHEAIGLTCFITYGLLPALFFIRFWISKFGRPIEKITNSDPLPVSQFTFAKHGFLSITILMLAIWGGGKTVNSHLNVPLISANGYTVSHLPDKVIKLQNEAALIYVKPIAGWFSSDHQPMICWSGSGYEFKQVQQKVIAGHTVYTSVLQNGKDKLFSAWWYYNGSEITTSQWVWRRNSLTTGQRYALVNVTAATPGELALAITNLSTSKALIHLF